MFLRTAVLLSAVACGHASEVFTLSNANFDSHLKDAKYTLVEFFAPWCGHCKKLEPEYEAAASQLKDKGVKLAKVDATEEKELASKYSVKGYPTLIWFEEGKRADYDGARTTSGIVEWVNSMTGSAVETTTDPRAPSDNKPRLVLHADSYLTGFDASAKANRRKATFFYVKTNGGTPKVVLQHQWEQAIEMTSGCDSEDKVTAFLKENNFPLFGSLDGDTFDKYITMGEQGRGLVWSLFPTNGEEDIRPTIEKQRAMMTMVAQRFKGKYLVTYTDVNKFKDAIDNMLSVSTFPAIVVQKKAGDKRKYVHDGAMATDNIVRFIDDVDAGRVDPRLKSEAPPPKSEEPVKQLVGTIMKEELFTMTHDVLLEVYAPWCGHCKKLEPEYTKLARKIKKEELSDLLKITKMDGTANDSPIDSMDWTGFPTIFFIKAGSQEPMIYEGERTGKGLWKYIKRHSTHSQEIKDRIERRKGSSQKGEEL